MHDQTQLHINEGADGTMLIITLMDLFKGDAMSVRWQLIDLCILRNTIALCPSSYEIVWPAKTGIEKNEWAVRANNFVPCRALFPLIRELLMTLDNCRDRFCC